MGDVVRFTDYAGRVRTSPVPTAIRCGGWRLAWTFQLWPVVGFVPVWVLDW
jgi:hypothetical protein